jgi:anthranilate synthase component I
MSFHAQLPVWIDLFDLHAAHPERYPFLLQSVAGHPQSGRYDLLFAHPQDALALRAGEGTDFFAELNQRAAALPRLDNPDLPYCGGWFLLLGFEAAQWAEPRLRLAPSGSGLPDGLAVRCPSVLIADRERRCLHLVSEQGGAALAELQADVEGVLSRPAPAPAGPLLAQVEEDPPQQFLDGVARILDYLSAGDVFQVNLSRAWRARLGPGTDYRDLYRRLRQTNPAPFAGLARWGGAAVISSSPERLVQVAYGWWETRPIAGTRPRGQGEAQDGALRRELVGNLKERAEHVMLIDLERNDLGRLCEPGTVSVSELMSVESYAHVHHIVSNIRGRLRADVGPGEVLRAVFPGGTITGCPKVRATEIIAELERGPRGAYTGAMGYLSRCGRLDCNILIRSLTVEGGVATLRAGAGIVADSQPEAELAETRAKARGLLLALGAAL